jgi:hypothetical protein
VSTNSWATLDEPHIEHLRLGSAIPAPNPGWSKQGLPGARGVEGQASYKYRGCSTVTLSRGGSQIGKECTRRHRQRIGDIDQTFIEQTAATMFNVNQDIAGHPRGQRQLLLGQTLPQAFPTNPGAHLGADTLPLGDTLRIVLAGAGGHAPQ